MSKYCAKTAYMLRADSLRLWKIFRNVSGFTSDLRHRRGRAHARRRAEHPPHVGRPLWPRLAAAKWVGPKAVLAGRNRAASLREDEGRRGHPTADAHRLLAEPDGRQPRGLTEGRAGGPRPLILIAERDPYAAEFMEYFLRREGYDVDVATDAAERKPSSSALSPQLVIVELLISGGEGAALCRRLKERSTVPVLVVSALDGRDAALAQAHMRSCRSRSTHSCSYRPWRHDSLSALVESQAERGSDRSPPERRCQARQRAWRRIAHELDHRRRRRPGAERRSSLTSTSSRTRPTRALRSISRPSLNLSTRSSATAKRLRFFDTRLVGRTVFYEDLGSTLASRGLTAALDRIDALTKERRPGLIVIDSFGFSRLRG